MPIRVQFKVSMTIDKGIAYRDMRRASRHKKIESYKSMYQLLSKRQLQLRAGKSRAEKMVKQALSNIPIRFIYQKGFLCKGTSVRLVDFALPDNRIFLEIDGPEHDPIADAKRQDQIKLSAKRYTFLRITNNDVFENKDSLESYLLSRIHEHKISRQRRSATWASRMIVDGTSRKENSEMSHPGTETGSRWPRVHENNLT